MPVNGQCCTQHGHGSRQASSKEVKELYHAKISPQKTPWQEKLYSHENRANQLSLCLEHPMLWLEKFYEVKIKFVQTVWKSMQGKRIEKISLLLCVNALACSTWAQCPTNC